MSGNQKAAFKTALIDVAKEITEDEAKQLAFECPKIPRADRDKIRSGVMLVERLETIRFVSADNVDNFIDLLERRNLATVSDILREYKQKQSGTTSIQDTSCAVGPSLPSNMSTDFPATSNVYPMDSVPRGKCLLLMYDEYDAHSSRKGNAIDMEKLQELFGKVLKFDVILQHNKTLKETEAIVKEMRESQEHGDCFICFVCSHGNGKAFLTRDGKWLGFQDLYDNFTADNCKALMDKPKVFFINACLNEDSTRYQELIKSGGNLCSDGPESIGIGAKESLLSPKYAHFCISYSTIAGYSSARHKEDGTFFVQNIYKVFKENYKRDHLFDLLAEVRKTMNEQLKHYKVSQESPDFSTLHNRLYFRSDH